ncbi:MULTISPECIES: Na+/H+ antiporter subunit E [Ureibacillus]|uniref:Multicomponent Na+:H+ antiporter subunit E n=1 Tax=Ureibacillus thermosphaericus TaxID=51173 RepID=A0A840PYW4_URETH|nr:Na+/H+ antiporter subunit E [Ureibacillus thermosphaericus]MBB5149408.1 multicomponent Na+:H+ antiporter subunit E [Ureibacillus thermosphaericus]NKZ32173.1 Na+/H+ antiporter subunit E [Ureibacillus thermosphaericus]
MFFAQFILNLFIALLWLLFKDEPTPTLSTFNTGFIVGIGILYVMHRFFGTQFYLVRAMKIMKLVVIFFRELIVSGFVVMKQVLTPNLKITPGIFKYKTILKNDWEVTALSLLLTLTPGSVVMEISESGDELYIHAMDIGQKEDLIRSLGRFETVILEVSR